MTDDVSAKRVLIIEDDATVAEVLSRYLSREGYEVTWVADGAAGLRRALENLPDLVILDLMLPGLGGAEVCRQLREVAAVPVIMLTALGEEEDRIVGLTLGADDYVAKPFSPRELVARVAAVLRRTNTTSATASLSSPLRAGAIEVQPQTREVRIDGEPVVLAAKAFDLLVYLMRHPGRAYRREELLQAVWGFTYGDVSTVTVHVRWLREKVETDPSRPRHVRTVWGVGYRFDP